MGNFSFIGQEDRPFQEKEQEVEIEKARGSEVAAPKPYRHSSAKFSGNISGAKTSPATVVWTKDSETQFVRICGTVFPAADKLDMRAVASGCSIRGMMEVNASKNLVKCHECGKWFLSVGAHIPLSHGMNSESYRQKHGLRKGSSLSSPNHGKRMCKILTRTHSPAKSQTRTTAGASLVAHRRPDYIPSYEEYHNLRMGCMAQLTCRITKMAALLGRCPSVKEMQDGDEYGSITRAAIEWAFHMTTREALRSLGLSMQQAKTKLAFPIQSQILRLRSQGKTYKEISELMGCSEPSAMKYSAAVQ